MNILCSELIKAKHLFLKSIINSLMLLIIFAGIGVSFFVQNEYYIILITVINFSIITLCYDLFLTADDFNYYSRRQLFPKRIQNKIKKMYTTKMLLITFIIVILSTLNNASLLLKIIQYCSLAFYITFLNTQLTKHFSKIRKCIFFTYTNVFVVWIMIEYLSYQLNSNDIFPVLILLLIASLMMVLSMSGAVRVFLINLIKKIKIRRQLQMPLSFSDILSNSELFSYAVKELTNPLFKKITDVRLKTLFAYVTRTYGRMLLLLVFGLFVLNMLDLVEQLSGLYNSVVVICCFTLLFFRESGEITKRFFTHEQMKCEYKTKLIVCSLLIVAYQILIVVNGFFTDVRIIGVIITLITSWLLFTFLVIVNVFSFLTPPFKKCYNKTRLEKRGTKGCIEN